LAVSVIATALVAGSIAVAQTRSGASCAPVREMLDWNETQVGHLEAHTHMPEQGSLSEPVVPTPEQYDAWARGLQQRAAAIDGDELSATARNAADAARRILEATRHAEPAPTGGRTIAEVMRATEDFGHSIDKLESRCPS
jgi:flavorubredoxin